MSEEHVLLTLHCSHQEYYTQPIDKAGYSKADKNEACNFGHSQQLMGLEK